MQGSDRGVNLAPATFVSRGDQVQGKGIKAFGPDDPLATTSTPSDVGRVQTQLFVSHVQNAGPPAHAMGLTTPYQGDGYRVALLIEV